jgi:hypothetical protein
MRLGEIPRIGLVGILVVTPPRGIWAKALIHEGLNVSAGLLSMAVIQLWLRRGEQSVAALVGHSQVLPETVEDLAIAVDALRPLTEAAEVRPLGEPELLSRYHAAVDRGSCPARC